MAKIRFSNLDKARGDEFDGIAADFDTFREAIRFYPGDTRPLGVKVAAIKTCLRLRMIDHSVKKGIPIPEEGE